MATIELYNGNCLTELQKIADNSIDSVVTDPPYELGFMGKAWDASGIAFNVNVWKECLRVLKPGGHILAFGGTRTYHRMTVAIEDAGFEIRDCIAWMYGSGFPKSHNIGNGIGTALKPAFEPVVMGRKPFKKTVKDNVDEWGTGGLNIDESRVGDEVRTTPIHSDDVKEDNTLFGLHPTIQHHREETTLGRWPANIMLDEEAGNILDEQWNGASRFFYCPKASKNDRDEGLNIKPQSIKGRDENQDKLANAFKVRPTKRQNIHPTVKPTALMEYLIKLVTPKDGIVLDPFMGSGSTGKGALLNDYSFVGIELSPEYFAIAESRIKSVENKTKFWC
jgi:DNA modification methylase